VSKTKGEKLGEQLMKGLKTEGEKDWRGKRSGPV